VSHRNAPLSETGRLRLARCVVEDGWPLRRAAERFQVAVTTAARWARRYRELGPAGMVDRSSRPHRSPNQTPTRTERRIIKVRVLRRWGPARIGYLLGIHPSTVHRVLTRYGVAKLRWLDRPTGRVIRRIETSRCGELVHVDVKKLGKIPAGGGWRMLGRTIGNHNSQADKSSGRRSKYHHPLRGHHFLHTAIDAHSRLAYSELLADEAALKKFVDWCRGARLEQLSVFFTPWGEALTRRWYWNAIEELTHFPFVKKVAIQTNLSCGLSWLKATKLEKLGFWCTYHPSQAKSSTFLSQIAHLPIWLHTYYHHRGHTALGGQPPVSRVPNLSGQYS